MAKSKVKSIAVLCSGGDSSGMNPCVRAVVRTAVYHGMEVFGVIRGYQGMLDDQIEPMTARSVSNIISRGGTILKTARCLEFMKKSKRKKAITNLQRRGIGGLVVIGGDGSFHGAHYLSMESKIKVVGIPGTIDNDINGTDFTIGYDTAINVAMDAIDKIRDTAASHDRIFFVEVMGRHAGYIALEAGVAAGAEDVLIPEVKTDPDALVKNLRDGLARGKTSSIIVVAEGDDAGGALKIAAVVEKKLGIMSKVTILGHLQRGGSPTAFDRVLASRLGVAAVHELAMGRSRIMVGVVQGKIKTSRLDHAWKVKKPISREMLKLNEILSV
ncbi:MAG: 6-phosphofructokinase [Planctomycetes bacterium]|nr:6-phosphofructokinase [Planctomycetota bacterium]